MDKRWLQTYIENQFSKKLKVTDSREVESKLLKKIITYSGGKIKLSNSKEYLTNKEIIQDHYYAHTSNIISQVKLIPSKFESLKDYLEEILNHVKSNNNSVFSQNLTLKKLKQNIEYSNLLTSNLLDLEEAELIIGKSYFNRLRNALKSASSTIDICVATISNPRRSKYIRSIFDELKARNNQGIKVNFFVASNQGFNLGKSDSKVDGLFKTITKKYQFNYYSIDKREQNHSKVIVIDKSIVILGSHDLNNISMISEGNTSIITKNKTIAKTILDNLNKVSSLVN